MFLSFKDYHLSLLAFLSNYTTVWVGGSESRRSLAPQLKPFILLLSSSPLSVFKQRQESRSLPVILHCSTAALMTHPTMKTKARAKETVFIPTFNHRSPISPAQCRAQLSIKRCDCRERRSFESTGLTNYSWSLLYESVAS